ncbi:MAG: hypothetical protein QOF51_973 [Chloroflexota bacterium]|nr:hypothetical protein [Chloroflexota bacterium]
MRFYRYSQWDGTQEIDAFTPEDVMEEISKEMLEDGNLRNALRRMMQRGAEFPNGRRMMGMQELLDRLRQQRSSNLDRYNMGSILNDIVQKLDEVIDTERHGIQRRLGEDSGDAGDEQPGEREEQPAGQDGGGQQAGEEGQQGQQGQGGPQGGRRPAPGSTDPMFREIMEGMARKRLDQLDQLPPDVGGRIRDLREYDFMEPEAREKFEELMQMLQQQVAQSYFKGLQQGLQQMTPEMLKQMQQMVHDLNQLLDKHRRGEDTPDDFEQFMKQWGQFFPEGIDNVEQLAEHMQQQIAQMESLLNSMTPEMRRQLEDMVESLFQDGQLQWELAQLAANLERMMPGGGQPGAHQFGGDEPVSLQEAMQLMGDMNSIDELERDLMQSIRNNDASNLNSDEIGRILGEEMRQMTEQMQQLTKMLEEAGLIKRKGNNEWELTARAVRKIGEKALQDIFGKLQSNTFGNHAIERSGIGIERVDDTKPYVYGDPFLIDSQRTIMNAIMREGTGTPIRMTTDDFEIYRTETLTQCTTVIMLDMSASMMYGGRFDAGRKMALALDSLIRTQFPKDTLHVVAFSYFVLTLRPEMLLDNYWIEYGGGTNFQEALRQARQLLSKRKGGTKQIIMITDGQPTTYTNPSGDDDWGWGGRWRHSPRAIEETLREVVRCTRDGILINTFMMERDRSLTEFVGMMARINRGRAFYATPSHLGEYVLVDYVNNKRKLVR